MRQQALYLKASLTDVKNVLQIYPTDIMRVDFYIEKSGEARPQSFSLSVKEYEALCDNFAAADEIHCTNFNVYCTAPTDNIVARVTGGGQFLYSKFPCSDLLADLKSVDGEDGAAKWETLSALADTLGAFDPPLDGAMTDREYPAIVESVGNTGNEIVAANLAWSYDTYTVSRVQRCYTGDAFPFEVPQCSLHLEDENGAEVASTAHGLAQLNLGNDVLNQAISGYAVHEMMDATVAPGPMDSGLFAG